MKILISLTVLLFVFGCQGKESPDSGAGRAAGGNQDVSKELTVVANIEEEAPAQKEILIAGGDSPEGAMDGWGFSVFDPQSKKIDYYTSKGNFLGSKKAN